MAIDKLKLIFDIIVGKNDLDDELGKAQKQAKQAENSFKKSFTGIKVAVAGIGTALAGIGFKKIIDLAITQENAVRDLNIAMKQTGEFSKVASQQMQNFASALQETSQFGDETILGQLALAKSFGQTNEQARKTISAAVELSAAMGVSLETAVRNLSKSMSGQLGELGELVPETKNLTKAQLEAGFAIDVVAKKFAGFSRQQTQDFSGQLNQVNKLWGDLLEEFGKIIIKTPEITAALKSVASTIKTIIKEIPNAAKTFGSAYKTVQEFADGVFDLFSGIDTQLIELNKKGFIIFDENESLPKLDEFGDKVSTKLKDINAVIEEFTPNIAEHFDEQFSGVNKLDLPVEFIAPRNLEHFSEQFSGPIRKIKKEIEDVPFDQFSEQFSGKNFSFFEKSDFDLNNFISPGDIKKFTSPISAFQELTAKGINALSDSFGPFFDQFAPIAGEFIDVFGQGPEQFQRMIENLARQLPVILKNILLNLIYLLSGEFIREFTTSLINELPAIVEALVTVAVSQFTNPAFWVQIALSAAAAFIKSIPLIIQGFINGFKNPIGEVGREFVTTILDGARRFVEEIINGVKDGITGFLENIPGVGGFLGGDGGLIGSIPVVGDVVGGVLGSFGFSKGGLVPGVGNRDTVPAVLTPGERVLTKSQNANFEEMIALLGRNNSTTANDSPINITLKIGQRELANVLLDLNRQNLRTA